MTRGRDRLTLALAMAVVLVASVTFARRPMSCIGLDTTWSPEREAGGFIQGNRLRGRLLSWFDWGQYAIWHFGPALLVSMDGRRETVYSAHVLAESDALMWRPDDNRAVLDAMNADYAWLPAHLPLVRALGDRGWTTIFSGPRSVILSRQPGNFEPAAPPAGRACFPGP